VLTIPGLERPGFVHGFSTRRLGQMRRTGEPLLTQPRRRFAEELGVEPERLSFAGAVHGAAVALVDRPLGVVDGCDALVTAEAGTPLFATFADCYPVVLFDPVRRAAALAHAGWRGTASGVAANAVRALESEYGSRPSDVLAGIGPGICGDCYEVSGDVAHRFPAEVVRPKPDGKFLLDLAAANRRGLLEAGLAPEHVFVHGACTLEDERLPSHRRDRDGGRFACIVALRPA
jgi:purine-nucleoside/S-methyl-5'-thioadenosine phosphorylase / adenosine deaminase